MFECSSFSIQVCESILSAKVFNLAYLNTLCVEFVDVLMACIISVAFETLADLCILEYICIHVSFIRDVTNHTPHDSFICEIRLIYT